MNSAPASRSVTLRLATANSERRLMRDPFGRVGRDAPGAWSGRRGQGGPAARSSAARASRTGSSSASSRTASSSRIWRALSSRKRSMNSAPGGVRPTTTWRRSARVLAAGGEAVVHDAVDETADGGQRHAEAGDDVGHVEVAGGAEEVQELGLGHRDVDLQELRRVAVREALHERLVARDDLVDDVGPVVWRDGSSSFGVG